MLDQYQRIQAEASHLYERYVPGGISYLQSATDPAEWMEIYRFADEPQYRQSLAAINADAEIGRLWSAFQALLDPAYPSLVEEFRPREWNNDRPIDER